MDGFKFHGRPMGTAASNSRNGTPANARAVANSNASSGGRIQIVLGPSPSRNGNPVNGSSGYGERDYNGKHHANGIVASDICPHSKRKAEAPGGLAPAITSAVKNAVAVATSQHASLTPQKKRGRPKGWKPGMAYSETTKHPRSDAAKLLYAQRMRENPNYHRKSRPGRPPGRPPGTERTAGRPVGRPVGRPPGSGSGAMKGPPKPRGRRPKKPPPTPREIYLSLKPRFEPYRCEWSGCRAELHNMATLRAHVHKIHGKSTGCRWAACAEKSVPDAPTAASLNTLHSGEHLAQHVEKEHMIPIQWLRGDGYKTGPVSPAKTTTTASYDDNGPPPAVPSYLLDKDGKEVTPWVWYQKIEDNATRLANKKRLQMTLFQMNEDAPSEEGDEEGTGQSV